MPEEAASTQTTPVEQKKKPGILFTVLGLVIGAGAGIVLDSVSMTWGAGIGLIVGLLLDYARKKKAK